jgi:hypothetical protein
MFVWCRGTLKGVWVCKLTFNYMLYLGTYWHVLTAGTAGSTVSPSVARHDFLLPKAVWQRRWVFL